MLTTRTIQIATRTMSDHFTDESEREVLTDLTDVQKGLIAIRSGHRLDITTPTGKQLEAMKDCGETVIIDSTDSYVQHGEGAHERLKKALRAVGTEWSLHTENDQNE